MIGMYIPRDFQVPLPLARAFLARYDFGTLVTVDGGVPWATHLPLLYRPEGGTQGVLVGHVARANPQWKSFSGAGEVLAVFQGPHAYVSPRWYSHHPSVPTWNYMVVHVQGVARPMTQEPAIHQLLRDLVARYDPEWKMDLPADYLDGMIRGIVAFEIEITRLEGKFKISQNRPADDQKSVQRELARSEDPLARELAALMLSVSEGRGLGDA
ncbi:MAG TPA: FMN-binding negative transcriptional regulator [Planctomycetota bacterium]|jgi:transcriptional regulator|nr:FMN-binding negative transcriptional regulator [Planctomycetota bacterium]